MLQLPGFWNQLQVWIHGAETLFKLNLIVRIGSGECKPFLTSSAINLCRQEKKVLVPQVFWRPFASFPCMQINNLCGEQNRDGTRWNASDNYYLLTKFYLFYLDFIWWLYQPSQDNSLWVLRLRLAGGTPMMHFTSTSQLTAITHSYAIITFFSLFILSSLEPASLWVWFCWRFLPVRRHFFIPTVSKCCS